MIDRARDGGFHALVGNPPYIRMQELKSAAPEVADFISSHYASAISNFDISLPFLELGLRLTRGEVSFIVPNKWSRPTTDAGSGAS